MPKPARFDVTDIATGAHGLFEAGAAGVARVGADDSGSGAAVETVLLVPADRVSVVAVDLPSMSAAREAEALRWAIEDHIAGDPEQQHVVSLGRRADGRMACAVVARADLRDWLEAAPRPPDRILPDAACLRPEPGAIELLPSGDRVLAAAGEHDFDRIEPELLEDLLPEWRARLGGGELVWIGDRPPAELADQSVRLRGPRGDPLSELALGIAACPVNLARGEFAPPSADQARRWRGRALTLAGLALALVLGHALIELMLLRAERVRASEEVRQRFANLFPEVTTLVRPRVQAQRELQRLRGGAGDRFLTLMRRAAPVFSAGDSVRVESLRFDGSALDLELTTPGMPDIEALQSQLRRSGLEGRLGEVTVAGDRTRARFRVEPAMSGPSAGAGS